MRTIHDAQRDEVLKRFAVVVRAIVEHYHGQLYQLFREGRSTEDFLEAFAALPHMHSRTMEGRSDDQKGGRAS